MRRRNSPGAIHCRSRIALTTVFLLAGCVENKPYRVQGIDDLDKYYSGQKPPSEFVRVSGQRGYRISFVEFDDHGDFWDRRQLGDAARSIGGSDKPVVLVTYVHGWHHNAKDRPPGGKNPGDVQTFRCLLSELAVSESTKNFAVHGVYIGWRGRLIEGPLDYLTFLDRKGAATRIAGTPVTETIFELIRQARKHPESKTVLIGHSFGALLLEKAVAQAMTARIIGDPKPHSQEPFRPPADLILLVNSAAESIYAKEMTDMFAKIGYRDRDDQNRPLLVSITSKGDTATGGWFPIGTFFPNLFAHRKYHWDNKTNTPPNADQNAYLTTTPGHNAALFTHKIDNGTAPPAALSPAAVVARLPSKIEQCDCETTEARNPAFEQNLQHPAPGLVFATWSKGNPDEFKWWKINAELPNRRTPYWILQVPKDIIPNHTPIFTPEGRALMAALYRIANPKGATAPRAFIQAQARSD
ncbi:MAG TPA: hypothetical protein VIU85_03875 [Chthoniobacterales bacterium]